MTRKKVLYGILTFFLPVIKGGAVFLGTLLPIITGYTAKNLPSAPANMYKCVGYAGHRIFILPDEEPIVVVHGNSPTSRRGMEFDRQFKDIKGAL